MLASICSFGGSKGKICFLAIWASRVCLHSLAHGSSFYLPSWQHSVFTSLLIRTLLEHWAHLCNPGWTPQIKTLNLIPSVKSHLLCTVRNQLVSGMWTSVPQHSVCHRFLFYQWLHDYTYFGAQSIADLVKLAHVSLWERPSFFELVCTFWHNAV